MTNMPAIAIFEPTEHPHRRFNPLTGKHVLVSPHRTKRPWNGQTEEPVKVDLPQHDPSCYLCPGNARVGGVVNPDYKDTYTFENDFPALLSDDLPIVTSTTTTNSASCSVSSLFDSTPVRGRCSVICFHPRHDLTLARMSVDECVRVVELWRSTFLAEGKFLRAAGACGGVAAAGGDDNVPDDSGYVQIFENRGAMMGASAPHPHGQVWSLSYTPDEPATELQHLAQYAKTASVEARYPCRGDGAPCLLCSYAASEVERGERVVELDDSGWVALVPFWGVWPFEIMILPYKRHIPSVAEMTPEEDVGLARILQRTLVRYDNLFSCPFPYSMGLHQSPLPLRTEQETASSPAHLHFHFYPPLLRSASVRKFLVGFEMLGEAQRDLTPEQAAARLRNVSSIHYLDRHQ